MTYMTTYFELLFTLSRYSVFDFNNVYSYLKIHVFEIKLTTFENEKYKI